MPGKLYAGFYRANSVEHTAEEVETTVKAVLSTISTSSNTSSGWGQNISIEDDGSGLETEDYSSETAWGSGMTIDGKPVK